MTDTLEQLKRNKIKESKEFKRENRYLVFKLKDIDKHLTIKVKKELENISRALQTIKNINGEPNRDYVVVEHDWPEYEKVWKMIEKRMGAI